MKKRILSILLGAALAISVATAINAYTPEQNNTAEAMNELGLLLGDGNSYQLDKELTRDEGITLVVRMLGKEAEAKENADTYELPFIDVDPWAVPYVGYAYANGITVGKSATAFASKDAVKATEFITWTLRALGYKDSGEEPQFAWDAPYELAAEKGLVATTDAIADFVRANAVDVFWNALEANVVGTELTLAATLIEAGVFTAEAYDAAKLTQKGEAADETTAADAETTVADEETTVADEETTVADEETTVADEETTVADEETTVADEETTAADEETTAADEETTVADEETTAADEETTVADEETTENLSDIPGGPNQLPIG